MKLLAAIVLTLIPAAQSAHADGWTDLMDGRMSQWDTYLSFSPDSSYRGRIPADAQGRPIEPIGYGRDPVGVFTVSDSSGELVLRISGQIYGSIFTRQEFSNYRLKLRVKWGTTRWPPRQNGLRDSGVLYHSVGPAGADYWKAWMLSQEFQVMEGHMGDYWNIAESAEDVRAFSPEGTMNAVANETRPFLPFGAKPSLGGLCLRSELFESRQGDWTDLELVCFGDKSLHIVNGHVVMVLRNSRSMKDGIATPLTKGRIQLQSEGSEVFFTGIRIQQITSLPAEFAHLYE
jgi:hypothetical protein